MTATITHGSIQKWRGWVTDNGGELVAHVVGNTRFTPAIAEMAFAHLTDRLAKRLMKNRGCNRQEADRLVALGFDWLQQVAGRSGKSLGPTPDEDIGWENLVLYTPEYAAVCHVLVGHFVHHIPSDIPGVHRTGDCGGKPCYSCTSNAETRGRHCDDDDDCRNGR